MQRSGNKARTQALNQIHQLLVTAPEELRARLRPLKRTDLLATCARFRIAADDDSLKAMTRLALRELAQRVLHLDEQLALVTKRLVWLPHRLDTELSEGDSQGQRSNSEDPVAMRKPEGRQHRSHDCWEE